jgi:hypothetical protein
MSGSALPFRRIPQPRGLIIRARHNCPPVGTHRNDNDSDSARVASERGCNRHDKSLHAAHMPICAHTTIICEAGFVSTGIIMMPILAALVHTANWPRESACKSLGLHYSVTDFHLRRTMFLLLRLPPASGALRHAGYVALAANIDVGVARVCTQIPKSQCTTQNIGGRAGTMLSVP